MFFIKTILQRIANLLTDESPRITPVIGLRLTQRSGDRWE